MGVSFFFPFFNIFFCFFICFIVCYAEAPGSSKEVHIPPMCIYGVEIPLATSPACYIQDTCYGLRLAADAGGLVIFSLGRCLGGT